MKHRFDARALQRVRFAHKLVARARDCERQKDAAGARERAHGCLQRIADDENVGLAQELGKRGAVVGDADRRFRVNELHIDV